MNENFKNINSLSLILATIDMPIHSCSLMQMLIPPSLPARNLLDKLLRIDHAKGLAAKYMYKGQLAVLNNGSVVDTLRASSI